MKKSKGIYRLFTSTWWHENLDNYNPTNKREELIVFNNMIRDTNFDKKIKPIPAELFMRGRKLNISYVFITFVFISYFKSAKDIKLNTTYHVAMKIPNKKNSKFKDFK